MYRRGRIVDLKKKKKLMVKDGNVSELKVMLRSCWVF